MEVRVLAILLKRWHELGLSRKTTFSLIFVSVNCMASAIRSGASMQMETQKCLSPCMFVGMLGGGCNSIPSPRTEFELLRCPLTTRGAVRPDPRGGGRGPKGKGLKIELAKPPSRAGGIGHDLLSVVEAPCICSGCTGQT